MALQVLTPDRVKSVAPHIRYISFGVDFYTDLDFSDACPEDVSKPHIEFVGMLEPKSGEWRAWTGKFYPVPAQEKQLLRITDLESHFTCVAEDRILLLGCNDLAMWSPRGAANRKSGSQRFEWCEEMTDWAKGKKSTIVLHHPHKTQSAQVWASAWANLKRKLPTVKNWASALRFSTLDCRKPKRPLDAVVSSTHHPDSLDVVVTRT